MSSLLLPSPITPSYKAGYARSASESCYPNLWRGMSFAFCPILGQQSSPYHDYSRNAVDITLNSGTPNIWQIDQEGVHVVLPNTGSTDYHITVGSPATTDVTLVMRIKPADLTDGQYTSDFSAGNEFATVLGYQSGYYNTFGKQYPIGNNAANSQMPAAGDDIWDTVIWSKTGTNLRGYVNGIKHVDGTITDGDFVPSAGLRIGGYMINKADNFQGGYAAYYMYNRGLSDGECLQLGRDYIAPFRRKRRTPLYIQLVLPPVNTSPPSIAGTPQTGQTLTCTPGTWDPAGDSYTYQWYRADDDQGTGEQAIAGQTALTYVVTDTDDGKYLRCDETATNAEGSATATSNYLGPAIKQAPVNTAPPVLSGTEEVGETLTCTPGTWNPTGDSYGYQWLRSDDDQGTGEIEIAGETGLTYVLAAEDVGKYIRTRERAANSGGTVDAFTAYTVEIPPPVDPPNNTVPPAVAGTAEVGQVLTCTPGTWDPAGDSYTYQWYRADDDQGTGEQAIAGETALTYIVTDTDDGKYIRCDETATNATGSATAESNYLGPAIKLPPFNEAPPVLTGTEEVGQTLTCTPGTWNPIGDSYAYQWLRSDDDQGTGEVEIVGQTSLTYVLAAADVGKYIRTRERATNSGGSVDAFTAFTVEIPPPVEPTSPFLLHTF